MTFVEQEVKKVADLTLKKLKEMDAGVAATLDPKFEKPNWSTLIKASITGDDEIPLNKRGSGVRRLILLNFFRAKAERMMREKGAQSTIYAVEEPETSQHPHNQRLLMRALQQLAVGDDQVIVTTHTPTLARAPEYQPEVSKQGRRWCQEHRGRWRGRSQQVDSRQPGRAAGSHGEGVHRR